MRTGYKFALGFFAVGYLTTLLNTMPAFVLAGVCFTACFAIGMLTYLTLEENK